METTLVILKPDAVHRRLIGALISRFERKGLQIVSMKMTLLTKDIVEHHYEEHRARSDFPALVEFMTSGPVVILALRGVQAISTCRQMIGPTVGRVAPPGTIRGDYGMSQLLNLVHAADSLSAAQRELRQFFRDDEIITSEPGLATWTYSTLDFPQRT